MKKQLVTVAERRNAVPPRVPAGNRVNWIHKALISSFQLWAYHSHCIITWVLKTQITSFQLWASIATVMWASITTAICLITRVLVSRCPVSRGIKGSKRQKADRRACCCHDTVRLNAPVARNHAWNDAVIFPSHCPDFLFKDSYHLPQPGSHYKTRDWMYFSDHAIASVRHSRRYEEDLRLTSPWIVEDS